MYFTKLFVLFMMLFLIGPSLSYGQTRTFESALERTATVELFTSEGCSSCPPADDWLNRLEKSEGLWTRWIPMVFHVDYWDYLGWKDPWSSAEFSNRQRAYADAWNSRSVYTPGMVLNGEEWRDWHRAKNLPKASPTDKPGVLKATVTNTGKIILEFHDNKPRERNDSFLGHAAILGFNQISNVRTGENAGKKLVHQFNVLRHVQVPMKFSDNMLKGNLALKELSEGKEKKLAVIFWISAEEDPTPIQAVGGEW